MKAIRSIKGTYDLLPADTQRWRFVEAVIHDFMELHGYGEIRTPAFEQTELFARGIGQDTDIVSKEMYSWVDQGGTHLTLKPELTAPVVRSLIQHQLMSQSPIVRLYYLDALFRRERPQKGRQRQFHQFGIEAFGSIHPEQDAEIISMAYKILLTFGISELTLRLNTIGSTEVRPAYLQLLRSELENHASELCSTCNSRLEKNALRVFDCKNESCQKILDQHAPRIHEHITPEDRDHFQQVCDLLTSLEVPYFHDTKLVRGLDYYSRTTFEITSARLGAQDALCGGGRYDGLVKELGGPAVPAIGFAAGIERILLAISEFDEESDTAADIYLVALGDQARKMGLKIADQLRREKGLRVTVETMRRSMKAQLRETNRSGAQFAIILAEEEMKQGQGIVKEMESGDQFTIPLAEIVTYFQVGHDCGCSDEH